MLLKASSKITQISKIEGIKSHLINCLVWAYIYEVRVSKMLARERKIIELTKKTNDGILVFAMAKKR